MGRPLAVPFLCSLALLVALALAQPRPSPLAPNQCELNKRCDPYCFFHGLCQPDGSCRCLEGWTGPNCTQPTCSHCGRHGHCQHNGLCKCSVGWTGPDCTELVGVRPFTKPFCSLHGECICDERGRPCATESSAQNQSQNGVSATGRIGPDLVPVMDTIRPYVEYRKFEACSCAVDEGCVKALEGQSKLLRFSMETLNKGNADLFIGDPGDYPEDYLWHQCHKHPHFTHWVDFYLIPQFESAQNNTRVGFKSGSTIIDSRRLDQSALARRRFNDHQQGIQIGWTDWYPYWLDCQWIDVTGLELGPYILEVVVNPGHKAYEINYENNRGQKLLDCNPACVNGKCDFGHSCVCDPGWRGPTCAISSGAQVRDAPMDDGDNGDESEGRDVDDIPHTDEVAESVQHLDVITMIAAVDQDLAELELERQHQRRDVQPQEEAEEEEDVEPVEKDEREDEDCTPQCEGLHCGPDGCGGNCGYCEAFEHCSPDGLCECTPQCLPDRRCGSDSCNGLCGECLEDEFCDLEEAQCVMCEATCTPGVCGPLCDGLSYCPCPDGLVCDESHRCVCVPDCHGKPCGASDGCGGTCRVGPACPPNNNGTDPGGCVPACAGRACGDDGCGGSCGGCPAGLVCLASGQCDCIPDCDGKQCGDDGCGGSCGDCADTSSEGQCFNGQCYCDDSCDGIECGFNACGRPCPGTDVDCSEARKAHGGLNFVCGRDHKCACEPTCDRLGFLTCGPDHCGGQCGDCPSKMRCFNDWRCVDERDSGVALRGFELVLRYLTTAFNSTRRDADADMSTRAEAAAIERARWLRHVTGLLGVPHGSVAIHNWTQTRVVEDHTENTDAVHVEFSLMSLSSIGRLAPHHANNASTNNASASTNGSLATPPRVFAERLINSTRDAAARLKAWDNHGFFAVVVEPKADSGDGGGGGGGGGTSSLRTRFLTVVLLGLACGLAALTVVVVAILALVRWRRRRFLRTGLSWVLTEEEGLFHL